MARGRNLSFTSAHLLDLRPAVAPAPRIENCIDCGSVIFTSVAGRCGECHQDRLEDIQKVREFISAHGARPPWEVMRQTGVSSSLIMSLMREADGPSPESIGVDGASGAVRPPRMYTRPHALRRQAE